MTGFSITPGTGAEDASGVGSGRSSRSIVPPVRSVVIAKCKARLGQCTALPDRKDVRVLATVTATPYVGEGRGHPRRVLWSFPRPSRGGAVVGQRRSRRCRRR